MDAPVAFARNHIATGIRSQQSGPDSQTVWVCDNVADVGLFANLGAAVYDFTEYAINPLNALLLPNFYTQFEDWERWRPIKCIVHYAHFAPTDTQGSVCLAVNEDIVASEASAVAATFSQLSTLSHSVVGSVYEDLSLECTPTSWREGTWLYNDATADTGDDLRFQYPGYVLVGTDNGINTTSQPTGILFYEMLFEVAGRRPPYVGVGLTYRSIRMAQQLKTAEERADFLEKASRIWLQSAIKHVERGKNKIDKMAQERERFLALPAAPPSSSSSEPVGNAGNHLANETFRRALVGNAPASQSSALGQMIVQSNVLRK